MCATNLRRHPPEVLGQSARVAAKLQEIDLRPTAGTAGATTQDVDIDLGAVEADEIATAPPADPTSTGTGPPGRRGVRATRRR